MNKTKTNCFIIALVIGSMISLLPSYLSAQKIIKKIKIGSVKTNGKIIYGQASYYANMFHGRMTANGETFSQDKLTAACNVLPLGTWVKVTNLKNGLSVIVKTNDRLHKKTSRLLDLTRSAAKQLGYIKRGLTRVKIELLDQSKYARLTGK
ncbi:MAG: septal ring lytic transglycosylase RlpA family protein [Ferruginibacter sp.]